jgi:plastocyanin
MEPPYSARPAGLVLEEGTPGRRRLTSWSRTTQEPSMRKSLAVSAVTVALVVLSGSALGSGTSTVKVADYRFVAKTIHVSRGATVTWRWVGEDPHNVTGHGFRSKTQKAGTFKHRFANAGTYKYVCTLHNKSFAMHGTVVVG